MSIQAQNTELNIVPGGIIPVVHVSQYDTGREISFTLYDGNAPAVLDSETVVSIEGTKPDGHGFSYEGTLVDNVVTFETTEQMTVITGGIECKLKLVLGSQVIGTALFILDVEKAGIDDNTIVSDTELPMIIALAQEQEENAEAWAKGTKNGDPVSPTDPQYHNSAKHWAEEAAAAVTGVSGVKGNAENEYRRGNVNLTPENLGALATDGDSKDNTVTFTSSDNDATTEKTSDGFTSVATMASGESHSSLFQKISKMFLNIRKLWNTMGTSALASGKTVTGLLGNTDISGVGSTVTGAISNLNSKYSTIKLQKSSNILTSGIWTDITFDEDYTKYNFIVVCSNYYVCCMLPMCVFKLFNSTSNFVGTNLESVAYNDGVATYRGVIRAYYKSTTIVSVQLNDVSGYNNNKVTIYFI